MKLGIIRLYCGQSGKKGFYNLQELGLARSLVKKGVKVDIFFLVEDLSTNYDIEIISTNIRIITIKAKRIMNHGIVSPKFLEYFNVDVVHLLSDNQISAPRIIKYCLKRNIPCYCYIGTIQSDSENKIKILLMDLLAKRNLKYYKTITTICKTTEIEKKLQKKGCTKTRVIPVGLDLDIIPPIEFIDYEFIEKLEANKYKILLFVGRLEEYKKPMEFIELMNFINKNSNEYKAILIGNGSLKNKVYEKIKEYSLENSISIIEKVENNQIHKYYKVSSAFINMNDKEIFGMSILEAMYQGCPVVAHNAPGPNDIISSGKSGIIVDNYDKEKWLDAIKIATTNDEFRVNAKKRIINELNWDSIATKFLDVIKEKVGVR